MLGKALQTVSASVGSAVVVASPNSTLTVVPCTQKFKRVITKINKKSKLDRPLMLRQPLKNTRSEISQYLETRRELWLVQRPNLLKI